MLTRTDEILKLVRGPEVLDVGCAGHRVTPDHPQWLHGRLRAQFRVTGIDISEANIAMMRGLGFDNLHVQSADSFELDGRYNTIVAGEILEHLSNPGLFFARARKHLAPGGRLVLSTPYAFSLMYALYALHHFPNTCENAEHTSWFCPRTIAELARRECLNVESWQLIDDYDSAVISLKYRAYWKLLRTAGKLLPDRIAKTTMLLVLKDGASD
jgi:2-polyprenyl-3-methyl-5-hydroxy-6-metoxy-1,4-benzoquinol methylase